MEITEVRIKPVKSEGRLLAFASITIDDCFAVHNLKVIGGREGIFVAMPSRRLLDGSHKDIAHPVNNQTRMDIEDRVLDAYQNFVKKGRAPDPRRLGTPDPEDVASPDSHLDEMTEAEALSPEDEDSFWATL